MNRTTRVLIGATITGTLLALTGTYAGPATARPADEGPAATTVVNPGWNTYPLRRIGDQFIRGDSLTGAGVPAPNWIPQ